MVSINGGGSTALGLATGAAKIVYAEPYGHKWVGRNGVIELNSIPTSADFIIISYEGKDESVNFDATRIYPTYEYIIGLNDIPENTTKNSSISIVAANSEGIAQFVITNNNNSSYDLKILGGDYNYNQHFNKLQITAFKNLK